MFINEERFYKDLSGSFHPKNEVYKFSYNLAILSCATKDGEENIRIIIDSVAGVAHLLIGDERDSFYGFLDGLDLATRGF